MDKIVFIAHTLRGDVEGNLKKTERYILQAIYEQDYPCCPWYALVVAMRDLDEEQHQLGIEATLKIIPRCDELWACGDTISEGVQKEIDCAERNDIPVRYLP